MKHKIALVLTIMIVISTGFFVRKNLSTNNNIKETDSNIESQNEFHDNDEHIKPNNVWLEIKEEFTCTHAYGLDWENPRIMYAETLPVELSSFIELIDIKVTKDYIKAEFINKSRRFIPLPMHLMEGNDLSRYRNTLNHEVLEETEEYIRYIVNYEIKAEWDTNEFANLDKDTNLKEVSHFVFQAFQGDATNLVAVKSPCK